MRPIEVRLTEDAKRLDRVVSLVRLHVTWFVHSSSSSIVFFYYSFINNNDILFIYYVI